MKVSVIIPTFNRAHTIRRAIDSVLAQTFTDFELVIVDDGSVDATHEVMNAYADERIRYIALTENRGVSHARNIGIREARGRYVAFLDSDDEWFPHKLKKQIQIFDRAATPNVGIIGCRRMDVDSGGNVLHESSVSYRGNVRKDLLSGWASHYDIMNSSIALVRRDVFDVVGPFDERMTDNEDYDMWVRISEKYAFDAADEPLARVFKRSGEARMDDIRYFRNKSLFFKKHESAFKRFPDIYSRKARWLGTLAMRIGEKRAARGYFAGAILAAPFCSYAPVAIAHLALSFLGRKAYCRAYKIRNLI